MKRNENVIDPTMTVGEWVMWTKPDGTLARVPLNDLIEDTSLEGSVSIDTPVTIMSIGHPLSREGASRIFPNIKPIRIHLRES